MLATLFLVFLCVILIGFDVAFSMILSSWLGIQVKTDQFVDTVMMPLSMVGGVDTYALVQVPLFILAGELMNRGGLTQRLIEWSMALFGHLRGSLGHVSIMTNLIMSGVSGSAVADAVATGTPLIPAMRKEGYGDGYAGAVIAAGALLGPIIPPSIPMIVYAQLSSQSVVKLFMSGVLPGLLLAGGFMVICTVLGRSRRYAFRPRATLGDRMKATGRAGWALFMPVLILAGIRFGLFTDTEVAAVAVIYALLVSLFVYRGLRFAELKDLIVSSGRSTGVILFLLAAAGPFSWLVAESQINRTVIDTMHSITSNPLLMLFIINVLLLLIGCLLEPLPAMVIFVPALLPLVHQLGIDPIQFGCVTVLNLMIGMMHPPIGLLLFVVSSVGRISLTPIMLEILPFFGWSLVVLLLTIFVPGVATWLPGTLH